ncbi:MAG: phosphatidate cytidylyltransferase [bacterium]
MAALETLGVRTLITVLFGPLILVAAWLGGAFFLAVVAVIVILAMHEFYSMGRQKGTHPATFLGIASGAALSLLLFLDHLTHIWLLLIGAFLLIVTVELFRNRDAPMLNVAVTLMGLFYIALPFGFLILIRELPGHMGRSASLGGELVILIFLAIWICDSAAYILGARFGKHKLFTRVSPNKTIEGTLFGFVFALVTAYVSHVTFLGALGLGETLVIGAICGSVGQVSDLIESLFKRDAGVKDSSSLIPGHGGVLDRFDSEILVAPVVYLYLRFLVV